jgi:RNA polymerase sigma-70 factor (ECF subfamily)
MSVGVTEDRQGDRHEHFSALFRGHYDAVLRYAARRVGPDAAEDVAEQAFLVAWRRIDELPTEPLPWLYGVARNVVGNQVRGAARANHLYLRVAQADLATIHDSTDQVVDAMVLSVALLALPPQDQEVLALLAFEGLSTRDASVVLGCSAAVLRMRLHRTRRRLREALAVESPDVAELPRPRPPTIPVRIDRP